MNFSVSNIISVIECESSYLPQLNLSISNISIDSRQLFNPEQTLFIAFQGKHVDGHDFIDKLYDQGVRTFIVSKAQDYDLYAEANFIVVTDVLEQLQSIARVYRLECKIPFIAITGSRGKTIVKEWLYEVMQNDFAIFRSPRSYNSQVGVPISIWQIGEKHQYALIEAGISKTGEMQKLEQMIKPDIGILTYIDDTHHEGFDSYTDKVHEKLKLFDHCKYIIGCCDDSVFPTVYKRFGDRIFSWGFENKDADVYLEDMVSRDFFSDITIVFQKKTYRTVIPFVQKEDIYNWMLCFTTLAALNFDIQQVLNPLSKLRRVSMKLEVIELPSNNTLITDTYNVDIYSLFFAFNKLSQQIRHQKFTVILSDIDVKGKLTEEEIYRVIGLKLDEFPSLQLILIGDRIAKFLLPFISSKLRNVATYSTTQSFLDAINSFNFVNEAILIKGEYRFSFNQLAGFIFNISHSTKLEINLTTLCNNLDTLSSFLKPQVSIMGMVKAFGYGSGSYEVAQILQSYNADYLSVAYVDEGVYLRGRNIRMPIMVMNADCQSFHTLIRNQLEPVVYSPFFLEQLTRYLEGQSIRSYPIHLEIDSGMHRLGVEERDIPRVTALITQSDSVKIKSIFSHFSASDDFTQDQFTKQQFETFFSINKEIQSNVKYTYLSHICNTAASIRFAEYQLDMVRLGISMYGVDPTQSNHNLQSIFTLKTSIAQIKNVCSGDRVGYGNIILEEDKTVATIRIGYADGFARVLGCGRGYVIIKGKKATVIGNVCMDMVMVDVTHISGVSLGDEVEIFGDQLSFATFCHLSHKSPYEVMANFPSRVSKIYVEE